MCRAQVLTLSKASRINVHLELQAICLKGNCPSQARQFKNFPQDVVSKLRREITFLFISCGNRTCISLKLSAPTSARTVPIPGYTDETQLWEEKKGPTHREVEPFQEGGRAWEGEVRKTLALLWKPPLKFFFSCSSWWRPDF